MVEEQNISNMTQNELLVSLYKDLQRSEQERQKQAELLEKLKNNADTGIKPDMNLQKELEEAKENIIGNTMISTEDSQSQLVQLMAWELADGNAKNFYDFEKNIRRVTLAEVKNLAKLKNYSFFALVPE